MYDKEVKTILAAAGTTSSPAEEQKKASEPKKRGRKPTAAAAAAAKDESEQLDTPSVIFPPSPLLGWFDPELFAVLGATLGFDHLPNSESWYYAGYLEPFYTFFHVKKFT